MGAKTSLNKTDTLGSVTDWNCVRFSFWLCREILQFLFAKLRLLGIFLVKEAIWTWRRVVAKIPRRTLDNEPDFVVENYGVDFRDDVHQHSNVNYFDTIFFNKGWLFKKYRSGAVYARYEEAEISINNKFWDPPDFIVKHGLLLISDRVKKNEIHKKYNQGLLPSDHHFSDSKFHSVENNISIRFNSTSFSDGVLKIDAQRVTYFDQAATNLAVYKGQKVGGVDLRRFDADSYGEGLVPKALEESKLANSLGVACVFEIGGEVPTLVPRFRPKKKSSGQKHAVMSEGAWHSSSSGVFEYKDLNLGLKPNDTVNVPLSRLEAGIAREIKAEAGLKVHEDYELVPLCLSREIPRAGKPQMFYKAVLNSGKFRTLEDLRARLKKEWKEEDWEYDDDMLYSDEFFKIINSLSSFSIVDIIGVFTYEGYANIVFAR